MTGEQNGGFRLRHWRATAAWMLMVFAAAAPGTRAASRRIATKSTSSTRAAESELRIVAANVQMLLIAPNGKETGYDSKQEKKFKQIPDSEYEEDALLAFDSGRVDPNTTQTIDVKNPAAGKYRLVVSAGTAVDGEEYEIRVSLYLPSGGERNARIAGTVSRKRFGRYELLIKPFAAVLQVGNRPATRAAKH